MISVSERWVRVGVASLPVLGSAALAYGVVLWRVELPDPVATHFDLTGDPEDSIDRNAFFWALLGAAGAAAVAGCLAGWRVHRRSTLSAWASGSTFVAWLCAGIGLWTLMTQRGLSSWTEALGPTIGALFALVAIPAVGAALASALALQLPVPPLTWESAPRLGLAPDEDAAWSQKVIAPWSVLPVMFGLGLILVGWLAGFGVLMVIGVVASIAGVQTRSLRVDADRRGLTLAWGPFGVPRQRVPLAEIAQATAIDVRPREWGGWGYRGSLHGFGTAGAILRAGAGLHLNLVGGRVFVVTVDDPEIGAGLLNDYVRRENSETPDD